MSGLAFYSIFVTNKYPFLHFFIFFKTTSKNNLFGTVILVNLLRLLFVK